jgi:hypothetical protein
MSRYSAMISELRVAEQGRVAGAGRTFARILRYKSDVSLEGEGSQTNWSKDGRLIGRNHWMFLDHGIAI